MSFYPSNPTDRTRGARARPPKRVVTTLGPWKGMRDRRPKNAPAGESEWLAYMENCFVRDPANASGVELRPSMLRSLSVAGARVPQAIHQYASNDGSTRYVFMVASGVVYRLNLTAGSPYNITATDVTPVGPTINTTGRVYMTTFNDRLIVSDGVNRPWVGTDLGSTPITGTNIQIDSASTAWAAFGPPAVYGGKLFVIRACRRTKIFWSEEGNEATGYEQTGYSNFWELTQTDSRPLHCLYGANEALYFFRETSIGAISGNVASDFTSSATRDSVSTDTGTVAPDTVVGVGNDVWFLDAHGVPCVLSPGVGVQRVGADVSQTLFGGPAGSANSSINTRIRTSSARPVPGLGLVMFMCGTYAYPITSRHVGVVFHAETRTCQGVWSRSTEDWITGAVVQDSFTASYVPTLIIGTSTGEVWAFDIGTSGQGSAPGKDSGSSAVAIPAIIETQAVGGDPGKHARWDIMTAAFRVPDNDNSGNLVRTFTANYKTARANYGAGQTMTVTAAFGTDGDLDQAAARGIVGVNVHGRAPQFKLTSTSSSVGPWSLDTIALEGVEQPPNAAMY